MSLCGRLHTKARCTSSLLQLELRCVRVREWILRITSRPPTGLQAISAALEPTLLIHQWIGEVSKEAVLKVVESNENEHNLLKCRTQVAQFSKKKKKNPQQNKKPLMRMHSINQIKSSFIEKTKQTDKFLT